MPLVAVNLCNQGYRNVSTGRRGKFTMEYTLKFTLIYKITIQLLILYLQGVQIFQFRNVNWPQETLMFLLQTFKVGINIYFSNVASKYGLMF